MCRNEQHQKTFYLLYNFSQNIQQSWQKAQQFMEQYGTKLYSITCRHIREKEKKNNPFWWWYVLHSKIQSEFFHPMLNLFLELTIFSTPLQNTWMLKSSPSGQNITSSIYAWTLYCGTSQYCFDFFFRMFANMHFPWKFQGLISMTEEILGKIFKRFCWLVTP